MPSDDQFGDGVHHIDCPDCDWQSREFEQVEGEIAAQVDAGIHYIDTHQSRIPDGAPFGHYQCPDCFALHGFNGTVSCSECGFIPQKVRA